MPVNIPGISIFAGIPPLVDEVFDTTGRVFFVGSTAVPGGVVGVDAAGAYGDTPQRPFATIDYAIGQCTASRGDLIIVLPGHAETVTAAIALDVAAVRIAGLGMGRNRPAITPSGAIDTLSVSAANCVLYNLRFVSQAADSTALINIAAGGTDLLAKRCILEQAETPVSAVTVNAARWKFIECEFLGVTGCAADNAFLVETDDCNNWRVQRCVFDYGVNGIDEGVIEASFTTIGGLMDDCTIIGCDTLIADFNSSVSAQGDGLLSNIRAVAGAGIADIDTAVDHGGYSTVNVLITDSVTESGSKTPVATPA